jgi:hypothetical protein
MKRRQLLGQKRGTFEKIQGFFEKNLDLESTPGSKLIISGQLIWVFQLISGGINRPAWLRTGA